MTVGSDRLCFRQSRNVQICLLSSSDLHLMCLCSVHPRLAHPVLPHAALLVQLHVPGVSPALPVLVYRIGLFLLHVQLKHS